jgi:methanogenic corrinoid protein MtbC1
MKNERGYPIKFVALKTGLSVHVIRAWEKRYSAISPSRSGTNRRLYTDAEVERLSLLQKATALGHSIGQIANLEIEELQKLVADEKPEDKSGREQTIATTYTANDSIANCLSAIANFDVEGIENTLLQASVALSQPALIDDLIVPLIHEVGERWQNGTFRVAHEHFASNILRTFLGNMRASVQLPGSAPVMIATTPTGQLHELGALIAAVTAVAEGWRVIYLGPNLPAEEIAGAAAQDSVKLIGLSIIYPTDDLRLRQELTKLRQCVGHDLKVFVGGRAAPYYEDIIHSIGATILSSMADFRAKLVNLV